MLVKGAPGDNDPVEYYMELLFWGLEKKSTDVFELP